MERFSKKRLAYNNTGDVGVSVDMSKKTAIHSLTHPFGTKVCQKKLGFYE